MTDEQYGQSTFLVLYREPIKNILFFLELPEEVKINTIMKKFMNLALCGATMLLIASCTSVKQTAPVMAIGSNNIVTNVKADIDYAGVKKIQGNATTHRVLWIFKHTVNGGKHLKSNNRYKGLNGAEATALYRAKAAADVDIVLEPEFETESKSYFFGIYKCTKVNATGWGANIKGFKDGTPAENGTTSFGGGSIF